MGRFALAVSLVLMSSTLAYTQTQTGNRPTFAVGDTWTFTQRTPQIGEEAKIAKVEETGSYVVVRPNSSCPACAWVYDKDLMLLQVLGEDGKPADASGFGFLGIGMRFLDFPLELKKTWRIEQHGLFRGNNVPYIIACTVSAYENVKTKAGTFKAYKIDRAWRIRVSTGPQPSWNDMVWYSPEAKTVVKFESGARGAQEWELASYSLKSQQ